ncbi:MAG: hypothetical protein LBR80_05835 [Deltaproteobacteria bacterium]|nr:hypothetical protein [Deltaproteobacteria bacterium]
MLAGKETMIPVFQKTYDGAKNDVGTLKSMLGIASDKDIKDMSIVMDTGLSSKNNIDFLLNGNNMPRFLASIPLASNISKKLIEFVRPNIDQFNRSFFI